MRCPALHTLSPISLGFSAIVEIFKLKCSPFICEGLSLGAEVSGKISYLWHCAEQYWQVDNSFASDKYTYVRQSRDYRVGWALQSASFKWVSGHYPARTSCKALSCKNFNISQKHHIYYHITITFITINVEPKGRHKPSPKACKCKPKQSHNPGMGNCLYQKSKASKKEMDLRRDKRDRWSWLRHEHGTCENFWQFPSLSEILCGSGKSSRDKYVIRSFLSHPLACRHPLPFTSSFTVWGEWDAYAAQAQRC